jgi:deoxyribonuclease-4
MAELLFGTAGTPLSTKDKSSVGGVRRIRELGLGCMEVEFVRGVRMGEGAAGEVGRVAKEAEVALSVHAPYYINLNSPEAEKREASQKRILDSARVGAHFGARGVAFHPAFYMNVEPVALFEDVKGQLQAMVKTLQREGVSVPLNPETTGKESQFGSLEEVLRLSKLRGVGPCIDFSHLHARSNGKYNSYREFAGVLEAVERNLGKKALSGLHIHLSGIAYGPQGEKHHLNLREADMDYRGVLKALKDFSAGGLLICESPNLEEDALLLQKTYRDL